MNHLPRPVFLKPLQLFMPVGAVTSILHRVTGLLLAIGIPVAVYLLDRSLKSPEKFADVLSVLAYWPAKMAAMLMVWALAFHVLAGLRHLFSDFNVGSTLHAARRSAWAVIAGSVAVGLLAAGAIW